MTSGPAARLRSLTARMRAHGYHAVGDAVGEPPALPWRALADLLDDRAAVRDTAVAHGRARGFEADDLDLPVAVSLLSKSLLGGPISTMVAGWTLDRWVPDLRFENLAARLDATGTPRTAPLHARELPGGAAADAITDAVEELADRTIAAMQCTVRVASRHLWGNVALQVRTPFQVLFPTIGEGADRDYEELAERFDRVAGLVLDVAARDDSGRAFHIPVRRTCCLLYKVPGKSYCSTCSLVPVAQTSEALLERALTRRRQA